MRATEIIRGVLDLIDQIECQHEPVLDYVIVSKLELYGSKTRCGGFSYDL